MGIVATVAVAAAVAGCGGGASPALPQPGALRLLFLHTEVSELKKQSAPAKEIACVEHNIDATSEEQLAERVVEGAPVEKVERESEAERLGSLGKGCF
jgi:hypothetical protein